MLKSAFILGTPAGQDAWPLNWLTLYRNFYFPADNMPAETLIIRKINTGWVSIYFSFRFVDMNYRQNSNFGIGLEWDNSITVNPKQIWYYCKSLFEFIKKNGILFEELPGDEEKFKFTVRTLSTAGESWLQPILEQLLSQGRNGISGSSISIADCETINPTDYKRLSLDESIGAISDCLISGYDCIISSDYKTLNFMHMETQNQLMEVTNERDSLKKAHSNISQKVLDLETSLAKIKIDHDNLKTEFQRLEQRTNTSSRYITTKNLTKFNNKTGKHSPPNNQPTPLIFWLEVIIFSIVIIAILALIAYRFFLPNTTTVEQQLKPSVVYDNSKHREEPIPPASGKDDTKKPFIDFKQALAVTTLTQNGIPKLQTTDYFRQQTTSLEPKEREKALLNIILDWTKANPSCIDQKKIELISEINIKYLNPRDGKTFYTPAPFPEDFSIILDVYKNNCKQ